MKKQFLAFDLGASSGRAIIGSIIGGKLSLHEVHRFENGLKEIDGSFHWDYPSLTNEIKIGLRKAFAETKDISAIAIDTWGVDYVIFDNDSKEMKTLPYHYRDERTQKYLDEIWSKISQNDIYKRTGIQYLPFNTLYQLYAHNNEHKEDLVNSKFLPMPDALAFSIGGNFTAEYTHASTSNLLNPISKNWDFELIEKLGLPKEIFPQIELAGTTSGTLSEELQAEFGVGAIPIVKVGSHDTASAVVAVPAHEGNDFAYISCGTWALLGAELKAPSINIEKQNFTNEGGVDNTVRFLTNIMGCWLLQEFRRDLEIQGHAVTFAEFDKMANDTALLKYFINPNDSFFSLPDNMIQRVKEFATAIGQDGLSMSNSEVLRAIYDSLGFYFKDKLNELEDILDKKYNVLNIIGGGTKDTVLMQSAANATNIKVVAGPVEATAIGNILVQAMACGMIKNINEAREIVRNSFEVVEYLPQRASNDNWDNAYEKFKQIIKEKGE